ncbi:MAG: hypothetical protein ND866_22200 [Pyrinomonadaceae bacterium]|nr:hypothetical protein [Pyrinomonadaceae bacterium]
MSELDEAWASALAEAESRARLSGRADVAAYLSLRNSNDLLRRTGIEWLISTFEILAGQANRRGASIQISKEDNHRFRAGNSTMVGRLLTLRYGVRQLSVEAGWPRTPRDGVVRGGGLASANIRHLGIKSASEALQLVQSRQGAPSWVVGAKGEGQTQIHETNLRKHIATLLASG